MKVVRALRALGPVDAHSVWRDPFLRWMIFFPPLVALLLRLGAPWLSGRLLDQYQIDTRPYYPLLMSFLVTLAPLLAGMVIGFLMLDQKDDQTLMALQVTPLTLRGYLIYRISLPMAISSLLTFLIYPLAGLTDTAFTALVAATLAAAPLAPLFALLLPVLAANKVQGFALMKAAGVVLVPPAIAFFLPPAWQNLFGLVPTYWPAKILWLAGAGAPYGLYLLAGLLYQGLLLALLAGRFSRKVGR